MSLSWFRNFPPRDDFIPAQETSNELPSDEILLAPDAPADADSCYVVGGMENAALSFEKICQRSFCCEILLARSLTPPTF